MKNQTNLLKYRFLAPVYDSVFHRLFYLARRRAFSLLGLVAGEKLLVVGIGTGEDLAFIPHGVSVTGIDLSEPMLRRARRKANGREVTLETMNAEHLHYASESFDAVILNLVLSVVENPKAALTEAVRVLKGGGRILVFDKFLPDGDNPGFARKALNVVTSLVGTDINRRFGDISSGVTLKVTASAPVFGGRYRTMVLEKT